MSLSATDTCWHNLVAEQTRFPFSWVGHIPFAMWLVCKTRPTCFVELGTHTGNSYLAICQSIHQHQLSTRCYAVDTWQGDEHAGHYDNQVYDQLRQDHDVNYGHFSQLMRMTFDEANHQFPPNTVDLLHIDGLHTYEAVKHDFETWLPKMQANGIILFHDIAVFDRGFGVYQLWNEIKVTYPHTIEFTHSNGLGVLFLTPPSNTELITLLDSTRNQRLLEQFARMGDQALFHACYQAITPLLETRPYEKTQLPLLYDKAIHELNVGLNSRDQHILTIEQTLTNIEQSLSWRITKPLRASMQTLRDLNHYWRAYIRAIQKQGFVSLHKHIVQHLRYHGLDSLLRKAISENRPAFTIDRLDYQYWIEHCETERKRRVLANTSFTGPLFSIIMPVYNPPLAYLREAIDSVIKQQYTHWELCIADDASTEVEVRDYLRALLNQDERIHCVFRSENGHISQASNSALSLASGEFVVLMDQDDVLTSDALLMVANTLVDYPNAQIIYSDEDKINNKNQRFDPYFKPKWNLELFLSHNCISHLGVYKRSLVEQLGGFRVGFEGAQDYDLALRCLDYAGEEDIIHIPHILYHWRSHEGSTAQSHSDKPYATMAAERALREYVLRHGIGSDVKSVSDGRFRVLPKIMNAKAPLISLIIPTRNGLSFLRPCIESIISKTTYPNYEIIVIDNGSDDEATLLYLADFVKRSENYRVLRDVRPFNYSALNNAAVLEAKGEFIGLINNDIEVITPDWLSEMVSIALREGVGAVGARLWYSDHKLQHGGVIVGLGGVAGHAHHSLTNEQSGYLGRALITQVFSAVTAACLIVKKSLYHSVNGLDETNLTVAFNDVDFCLKLQAAGYRNVWTPFAELYHHESVSRGYEDTPEKKARFEREVLFMQEKWGDQLKHDPYYHPAFSLVWEEQFQLARC